MISPSIGRVVWFYTTATAMDPQAAIVTKVWSDRMVNLAVFSFDGLHSAVTSVSLLQDDERPMGQSYWCEWMPFQKGQAAKTEALEKELSK